MANASGRRNRQPYGDLRATNTRGNRGEPCCSRLARGLLCGGLGEIRVARGRVETYAGERMDHEWIKAGRRKFQEEMAWNDFIQTD